MSTNKPWITLIKVIAYIVLGIVIVVVLLVGFVLGTCLLHK